MEFVLCAMIAAVVAALATWLVLRTKTARLQERLAARDVTIAELETRLASQLALSGTAQEEVAASRQELAALQARLEEERKAALEKQVMFLDAQARLSDAFKALSADALKSNNEAFLNLARTTLEKFQEGARSDLDKRQLAIDQLMKPVQETLGKFDAKIGEIEKSRIEAYGGLSQQVRGLATTQECAAAGARCSCGAWWRSRACSNFAILISRCTSRARTVRCAPTWSCACRAGRAWSSMRRRR
jgi:DNA recombination protein RmuC